MVAKALLWLFLFMSSYGNATVIAQKISEPSDLANQIDEPHSTDQDSVQFYDLLIYKGQQAENEQKYEQAFAFYQAAKVIDVSKTLPYLERLAKKIDEANRVKIHNEKKEALLKGAQNGNADDAYQLGEIYWKENLFQDAINMWNLACQHKHPDAALRLAKIYEEGINVPMNLAEAEHYYKIGAINGNAQCAYIVAKLLEIQASQNPDKSEEILKESQSFLLDAADRGHAEAAMEIGYILSEKGDHSEAIRYFEKAKNNAKPDAVIKISLSTQAAYNLLAEKAQLQRN